MFLILTICMCFISIGMVSGQTEKHSATKESSMITKTDPSEYPFESIIDEEDEASRIPLMKNDYYYTEKIHKLQRPHVEMLNENLEQNGIQSSDQDIKLQRKSLPIMSQYVSQNNNQPQNMRFQYNSDYPWSQNYLLYSQAPSGFNLAGNQDLKPFRGGTGNNLDFNYQAVGKHFPNSNEYSYNYPAVSTSVGSAVPMMPNSGSNIYSGQSPYNVYLSQGMTPVNPYSNLWQFSTYPYQGSGTGSNYIYPDSSQMIGNPNIVSEQNHGSPYQFQGNPNAGMYNMYGTSFPNQFVDNGKSTKWQMPAQSNVGFNIYAGQYPSNTYPDFAQNVYTGSVHSSNIPNLNSGQSILYPNSGQFPNNPYLSSDSFYSNQYPGSGQMSGNYFNSAPQPSLVYPTEFHTSSQIPYNAYPDQINTNRHPSSNYFPDNNKASTSNGKNGPNVQFFFQGKPISGLLSGSSVNGYLDSHKGSPHNMNGPVTGPNVPNSFSNSFLKNGKGVYNEIGQRNPYDQLPFNPLGYLESNPASLPPFFQGIPSTSSQFSPFFQGNPNNPSQFPPFFQGNSAPSKLKHMNYRPIGSGLHIREPIVAKTTLKVHGKTDDLKDPELSDNTDNSNESQVQDQETDEQDTSENRPTYKNRKHS